MYFISILFFLTKILTFIGYLQKKYHRIRKTSEVVKYLNIIHDHPLYFFCPDLLVAVCETSYVMRG
jgi:hypothetical protein